MVGPEPSPPARRKGAARPDKTAEQPSPYEGYQTGSDYEVADDDTGKGDLPALDDDAPSAQPPADEDIYGEDDPFPEDEDDNPFRAEETRIAPLTSDEEEEDEVEGEEDANATRAGPPIHLEVIAGPDEGKTKKFRGVRMVIGRTQGCDFRLADGSVSRRHVELVLGDDGVLLRDLGSGNGTRVNGEKVNEKVMEDGDEIAIGQTRFRFVDELQAFRKKQQAEDAAAKHAPGPAEDAEAAPDADPSAEAGEAPAAEAPDEPEPTVPGVAPLPSRRAQLKARGMGRGLAALEPRQKKLLVAVGGGVVLLLVVIAALSTRSPPPPPVNPKLEQAAVKLQEARAAALDHRFDDAVALAEQAERLVPGSDSSNLAMSARKEAAAQRALEDVRALVRQKKFGEAKEALAVAKLAVVVGEGERDKVRQEIDGAIVADAREQAVAALDQGDPEAAQEWMQKLPRSEAMALQARLEEVKVQAAQEQAEQEKEERQQVVASRRRQAAKRAEYVDEAFAGVQRKFHAGDFQRAVLECDHVVDAHRGDAGIRSRARELKKLIPSFARAFDEGHRKYRANNLDGAARPLRKARELYREIGFEGALGAIIDEELAAAALSAGKAALSRNDPVSAVRNFKDALELNPSETRARQGLDAAYKRAEDLYLEAYMIRDRDPKEAAQKFRIVLDILPSDSPTHEKAKNQLKNMGL